jgi:large subunit ribosomal protein L24
MHIKRNDIVVVIRGSQKSSERTGKVLAVNREKGRALVEGFNLIKRHMRRSQDNPKGGIVEKEAPLALANLMLHCPHCKTGVKIKRVVEGGKKLRKCKGCGHAFDA